MFGERRKLQRLPVNRVAKLLLAEQALARDCTVINISDSGARLLCEYFAPPDAFRLTLLGQTPIQEECEVVWRLGHEIGVKFVTKQREQERSDAIKLLQQEARNILRPQT